MNQKYKDALSQVEYVLNQIEPEELVKIPQNFKEFIAENKCKWHNVAPEEELSEEAQAILAIIYRKFLAPVEERAELERQFQEKLKKETEELKLKMEAQKTNTSGEIKYSFAEPTIVKKEEVFSDKLDIMEYKKEIWYIKLLEKIKKLCRGWHP